MKKLLSLMLVFALFFIVGCNSGDDPSGQNPPKPQIPGVVQTCTVSFDSVGGVSVPDQKIEKGEKAQEPEHFVKMKVVFENGVETDYVFDGWYDGDIEYNFDRAVESDLALTARWIKTEVSIPREL